MLSTEAEFMNSAACSLAVSSPCAAAVHTARSSVPAFLPVLGTVRTFYTKLLTFRRVKILIAFLCLTI